MIIYCLLADTLNSESYNDSISRFFGNIVSVRLYKLFFGKINLCIFYSCIPTPIFSLLIVQSSS